MQNNLSNCLLVAAPSLKDPMFSGTVIFLALHDEDHGALGVVINRPGTATMESVYDQLNLHVNPDNKDLELGWGGPVQPTHGYILHSPEKAWALTINQPEKIALTVSPDIIEAMSRGASPEKVLVTLGCAAWDAGQLEGEIVNGDWLIAPADPRIVFDLPPSERYDAALALVGLSGDALGNECTAFSCDAVGHA